MNIKRRPPETSPERVTVVLDADDIEKAIRLYVHATSGERLPTGDTQLWGLYQGHPDRRDRPLTLCIDVTEPD